MKKPVKNYGKEGEGEVGDEDNIFEMGNQKNN